MSESKDLTLGIFFIATMIAASLWGVSCLQTYSYFNSYQRDRRLLKCMVIVAWSLDTLHQALISHASYFYLVTNRGDEAITALIVWSVHAQALVSSALAVIVQSFFVFRIWKLSKQSIVITTPVAVLVLAQLISNVIFFCKVFVNQLYEYSQFASIEGLFVTREVSAATSDVFLAITLIYLLRRSRTGFENCDTIINRLIVYTINTGLFTSLNTLCSVILCVVSHDTSIYVLFYFIMARLYFNSLMANLNMRKVIGSNSSYLESDSLGSLRTPNRTGASGPLSFAKEGQATHSISVKIDTILETRRESDQTAGDDRKSVVV